MPLPPPPAQSDHSRAVFRNNLGGETAYQRHQRYVHSAQIYGSSSTGASSGGRRTDLDVLKDNHQFLREDDGDESNLSYDDTVALKYYRSLFKEFAVCDLKHYKSGNFALRWRTEDEVVAGNGQFTCGNTRCAYHDVDEEHAPPLITLELPFGYVEHGQQKSALVKVVLCSRCKKKLMWKREQEKARAAGEAGVSLDAANNLDEEERHDRKGSKRSSGKRGSHRPRSKERRSASPRRRG